MLCFDKSDRLIDGSESIGKEWKVCDDDRKMYVCVCDCHEAL